MKNMKIDMHTHTKGSDGAGTPEQIAAAAKNAGLDGICLTDHHKTYTAESLEVAAKCRSDGLFVIHGCEVSALEGHILVYGVNVDDLRLAKYTPMQAVIDRVNAAGGFAAPSHPFKGHRSTLGDRVFQLKGIRALEVANGQNAVREPWLDAKAVDAGKSMRKMTIGGSDAHFPENTGLCYTVFEDDIRSEQDFLRALKRGSYRAVVSKRVVAKANEYRAKRITPEQDIAALLTASLDMGKAKRQGGVDAVVWNRFNTAKKANA